jgi:hypothetical protein
LNPAAALDLAAKTLTLASTALYLLGYIDAGTFLSLITAAATLISTLIIHRMGKTIHAAAQRRRAGPLPEKRRNNVSMPRLHTSSQRAYRGTGGGRRPTRTCSRKISGDG